MACCRYIVLAEFNAKKAFLHRANTETYRYVCELVHYARESLISHNHLMLKIKTASGWGLKSNPIANNLIVYTCYFSAWIFFSNSNGYLY